MIKGFKKFKEYFQDYKNQYTIIGGTACDLLMEREELQFRTTKDIDMVLILEFLNPNFGKIFWEFVKDAGYLHINKSTGEAEFYRFSAPTNKEFPYMIEVFSRYPNKIIMPTESRIVPIPIGDDISSLSAILLDEKYYRILKNGQVTVEGIPILKPTCLIPFKVKAYLDLKNRKLKGDKIDSKDIAKHKNDVFRLAQLISLKEKEILDEEIKQDLIQFMLQIKGEDINFKQLGIKSATKESILELLCECYDLDIKDL